MRKPAHNLDELYPDDPPRQEQRVVLEVVGGGRAVGLRQPETARGHHAAVSSTKSAAWMATKALLFSIGGVVSIAYFASLPRVLQYAAGGFAGLTWFVLFKMFREYQRICSR